MVWLEDHVCAIKMLIKYSYSSTIDTWRQTLKIEREREKTGPKMEQIDIHVPSSFISSSLLWYTLLH